MSARNPDTVLSTFGLLGLAAVYAIVLLSVLPLMVGLRGRQRRRTGTSAPTPTNDSAPQDVTPPPRTCSAAWLTTLERSS
jgi:hypothetical protein